MFNSSLTETDNLLFKTGVIVQEIEEGKTFEEGQRYLRECLNSARKNEETIAIGLYNFSGERRSQMSLKKEELFLVRQTSQKWLHAKKDGDKSGLVPNNYIQCNVILAIALYCLVIFERNNSYIIFKFQTRSYVKKQAIEDYKSRENYSLSFKRGDIIEILKEHLGWAIGRKGEEFGYFPLKYVVAFQG